ncbi:proton-coupled folate transporter-like isoform X2, partial [Argonauta hians]
MLPIKHIVEPILFFYMFSQFMFAITFQNFLLNRLCLQSYNKTFCSVMTNGSFIEEENLIQKETSHWILYANVMLLVPSTIVSFFLGSYSDTISRKIVIVLPIVGSIFMFGIYTLISHLENVNLGFILIGNFLAGIFGGYIGIIMAILSYATHVTKSSFRTIRIGIVESMIFLAGTLGIFLGGFLPKYISYTWIFGIITICAVVALIYAVFVIEDISPNENSFHKSLTAIFKIKHIKDLLAFITKPRDKNEQIVLFMAVGIMGILMFLIMGESDIKLLYLRHSPISATVTQVGYYSSLSNLVQGIGLLVLLPLLKRCFNVNDFILCLTGLTSRIAGSTILGLSQSITMVYLVPFVRIFLGLSAVSLRGICSRFVLQDEQGKLFTVISCLENFASLFASLSFNNLYNATISIDTGFCFFLSAGISFLLGIATLFMWKIFKQINSYKEVQEISENN